MSTIVFLETVISYGGARKSTVELARRLQDSGYEVLLYDAYGTCQSFLEACKDNNLQLRILCPSKDPHIILAANPIKRLFNRISFLFNLVKINNSIHRHLLVDKPQYIIVNNSKVLSFILRKPKDVKIMLFARGWFIGKQIRAIDRFLYKHLVDRFVCVSEATRHAVYGSGLASLKDIYVVHNAIEVGLDDKSEQKKEKHDTFRILVSGGFLPTKGLHLAISMALRLLEEKINFQITITGIIYKTEASQKYFEKIKELIELNHLENYINLVINHNDVREYFEWCDVLVHPSNTEGLPRVVMEAMALKKPVIANAVGGVTDYILDEFTGLITNYNNVEEYVESIIKLSYDTELYNNISNRAYDLIKTSFSPQNQIIAMKKALK